MEQNTQSKNKQKREEIGNSEQDARLKPNPNNIYIKYVI